jgi:hypothetical protein
LILFLYKRKRDCTAAVLKRNISLVVANSFSQRKEVYVTDKPKHISRKEKREHLKEASTTNKRRELIQ